MDAYIQGSKSDLGIGGWSDIADQIIIESFNLKHPADFMEHLSSDFLRKETVSVALHPNQWYLGNLIGEYLSSSPYGSKLISLYSDSLLGTPYLVIPKFSTLSSVSLQHLSYLELIFKKIGISLLEVNTSIKFIDFGGGYGNLARILTQINDNISVHIIDIPSIIELQKVFLRLTINSSQRLDRIQFHFSNINSYKTCANNSEDLHLHFHASLV